MRGRCEVVIWIKSGVGKLGKRVVLKQIWVVALKVVVRIVCVKISSD